MNIRPMRVGAVRLLTAVVTLPTFLACAGSSDSADDASVLAQPAQAPAECVALWEAEPAVAFVDLLVQATAPTTPVWVDYEAAHTTFVLHTGNSDLGEACLGMWRGGRAVAFGAFADGPKLLTIMYGYYLTHPSTGRAMDGLLDASAQPEPIRAWLEDQGATSAVLLPVDIQGLPFEISALQKVQLSLHEAFHVDVQSPQWFASEGDWPVWDLQPDRPAVQQCYTHSDEVAATFVAERTALSDLITALLDGERAAACQAGASFLDQRSTRYSALSGVEVLRQDETPGTCSEAEAIMEIEEGIADYVSWTRLYDLGLTTRARLEGRYRAQQADVYYLTGAMQLHAIALMQPGDMAQTTREIANSTSAATGSLTNVFTRALAGFCEGPNA